MSMTKVNAFLKEDGNSLIFKGDGELVYYIPENYFRNDGHMKYAEEAGEYINTLGLFSYEVFDSKGKSIYGVKLFNHPVLISCMPSSVEKVKDYILDKKIPVPVDYRILRIFMITGNIPNVIPYDELHTFLMDSIKFNGSSFGISAQMFGILVSELCRSTKDESVPFRLAKETDMHKYKPVSIKMIPKYISAFTSITSENWDDAVVNAVINKNKVDSPMEKILMT